MFALVGFGSKRKKILCKSPLIWSIHYPFNPNPYLHAHSQGKYFLVQTILRSSFPFRISILLDQVVTFPKAREGVFLSTHKLFLLKVFWVKGFSVFKLSSEWNSLVINLVFGLALWKALVSFRHDVTGSSGFSADAHRHQVSLGLSFKQVGLWFIHPLSFGSRHLSLGCSDSTWTSTPSPSIPLVHRLFLVRPLDIFYHDLLFISACADLMLRTESPWNIQDFYFWFSSLMRGLVRHRG